MVESRQVRFDVRSNLILIALIITRPPGCMYLPQSLTNNNKERQFLMCQNWLMGLLRLIMVRSVRLVGPAMQLITASVQQMLDIR